MDVEGLIRQLLKQWDSLKANELYQQIGRNDTLKKLLVKSPHSLYAGQKIRQEFRRLLEMWDKNELTTNLISNLTSNASLNPISNSRLKSWRKFSGIQPVCAEDTEKIAKIEERWRENYKVSSRLNMLLDTIGTDEERGKIAFEILERMDLVYDDWEGLDHYQEHHAFLPSRIAVDLSAYCESDLYRRLLTLRTYLAPSKSKIYTDKQQGEFQAEKEAIEKRLAEL